MCEGLWVQEYVMCVGATWQRGTTCKMGWVEGYVGGKVEGVPWEAWEGLELVV